MFLLQMYFYLNPMILSMEATNSENDDIFLGKLFPTMMPSFQPWKMSYNYIDS
jgi:hypothetical protein